MGAWPKHVIASIETLLDGGPISEGARAKLRGFIDPGRNRGDQGDALDRRNGFLRRAGEMLPAAWSDSAKARLIATRIGTYRECGWRHDRTAVECPTKHAGTMFELIWKSLREVDAVLGAESIRKILAKGGRHYQKPGAL